MQVYMCTIESYQSSGVRGVLDPFRIR
jgi:hypothetical protein